MMFKNAKIGDRVYDLLNGWGIIIDIKNNEKRPIYVKAYNGSIYSYMLDGRRNLNDKNATLFWDKILINAPNKPFNLKDFLIGHITPKKIDDNLMGENHFYFSYCDGDYYDLYDYEWYVGNDYAGVDIGKFYFDIIQGDSETIADILTQKEITYSQMIDCLKELKWI